MKKYSKLLTLVLFSCSLQNAFAVGFWSIFNRIKDVSAPYAGETKKKIREVGTEAKNQVKEYLQKKMTDIVSSVNSAKSATATYVRTNYKPFLSKSASLLCKAGGYIMYLPSLPVHATLWSLKNTAQYAKKSVTAAKSFEINNAIKNLLNTAKFSCCSLFLFFMGTATLAQAKEYLYKNPDVISGVLGEFLLKFRDQSIGGNIATFIGCYIISQGLFRASEKLDPKNKKSQNGKYDPIPF